MSYDLKRSHFSIVLEKSVEAGAVITEEGVLLASLIDPATGTEVVRPATDGAITSTETIAGFAIRDNADNATSAVVEELTIPSSGPFTLQLANNNIVATVANDGGSANMRVVADAPLTLEDTGDDGGVASGEVGLEPATGILTFNTAQGGQDVVVTYTYNLTVAESRLKFFQRNINNEASTLFGSVGVGHGHGEIFTDQFDATQDWSTVASAGTPITAGGTLALGNHGIVTTGGAGTVLDARVVGVPNVNNPLLGLSFNIGGSAQNAA